MKIKKIMALGIAATLAFSVMACGGKEEEQAPAEQAPAEAVTEAPTEAPEPAKEEANGFDASAFAGEYVFNRAEEYDEWYVFSDWLIINPDGTGYICVQDTVPIDKMDDKYIYVYGEPEYEYFVQDGCIALIRQDDGYSEVYFKTDRPAPDFATDVSVLPKEEEASTEVVPGNYVFRYADEMDEWYIFKAWLQVNEDGAASIMYQDYGPSFLNLQNGICTDTSGDNHFVVVHDDAIMVQDGDLVTVFTRTDEPCDCFEEHEMEDYPDNEFEARINQFSFESPDEIIGKLKAPEAYALVDMRGSDEKVLLVADATTKVNGKNVAMEATPYIIYSDGTYMGGSLLCSQDEAYPLAMKDGLVFCKDAFGIDEECLGSNGTKVKGIMVMTYAYKGEDENGDVYYGGFVREDNTVVDNDGYQIKEDESTYYEKALSDLNKAEPIAFTIAE